MTMRWRRLVVLASVVAAGAAPLVARQSVERSTSVWMLPPTHEQQLSASVDGWEPALAVGPGGRVVVTAGQRSGAQNTPTFDQRLIVWRSDDRGETFGAPVPTSAEGRLHGDQRVAMDEKGTISISYMDEDRDEGGKSVSRLRLARSTDGGRSFAVQTVVPRGVVDKPELGMSQDGRDIYMVYEAGPGPTVVASHDGGATWGEPTVVQPSEGRHFFPEGLVVARDGSVWFAVLSMSDRGLIERRVIPVQRHVFRSTDGGRTWRDSDFGTSPRHPSTCVHDPHCGVQVSGISVAIDGDGHAHAIYTAGPTAGQPFGLFHRRSTDGGAAWSAPVPVSDAPRSLSNDQADRHHPIAAAGAGYVCAVWVDDRRGGLDVWARCSADGARTWGSEVLLSDRPDGAPYKSATGFARFYGHYGGAAIDSSGRLHAAWSEGDSNRGTGTVWVNHVDVPQTLRR